MRVRIHRGANEIGGSCVEVECQDRRIVLDVGLPLNISSPDDLELPDVQGFRDHDPSLLGIIISHPHQDHYGLAEKLSGDIPIFIGAVAERILARASLFTGKRVSFANVIHLTNERPILIGPFTVTPFLMDHSAFDSYAILVEGDDKRLFYTGDLRAHGRKGSLFQKLVEHPPSKVDVLLMEGSTLGRASTEMGFPTESHIEDEMTEAIGQIAGMALVWCSGQNIDRLVTVFRACIKSGRQFIIDMYTAEVLRATENPRIPQAEWERIKVFLPASQKARIIEEQAFEVANPYRRRRIFPENLKAVASGTVMLFRPSMMSDLEAADCLKGAGLVYSMWDGYLKEARIKPFLARIADHGIPMVKCHTSGHASVKDLQILRNAFSEAVVVPIHTEHPGRFDDLFGRARVHGDGEWWEV